MYNVYRDNSEVDMKIRNSIIDQLEHETDKYTYALNIGLKSGEIILVDGVCLGEKNAYINFAKYSKETMILEIDNSLYRIGAGDIESINVKKYNTDAGKVTNILNYLFLSKGRFDKYTYIFWIKWFIAAIFFCVLYAAITYVTKSDLSNLIPQATTTVNIILQNSVVYMRKVYKIILYIQLGIFVFDLILPPKEAYKRIKPYLGYAEPTRLSNLVVIVIYMVVCSTALSMAAKAFALK